MFEIIPMTHFNRSFRNPFAEMDNLARAFFNEPFFSANAEIRPFRTDIKKTEDGFQLEAELPGFNKKDISVGIEGDVLTIKAQRSSDTENKDNKENYVRIERSYGSYERSFDVSGIDTENIGAKYENGVLILNMPKKEPVTPPQRQLTID
ncbi:MAG: Hsp20/alpha crystallin family protein [Clostridia bacterium]|nr:Hsp20/alpha crystallin family protein [Clostridia bacterium]